MKKVVFCYRVAQRWRIPLFEDLTGDARYNFRLLYSHDFVGTKVVSGDVSRVNSIKLWSINFRLKLRGTDICVPLAPNLFFVLLQEKPDVIVSEGKSNLFANIICFVYSKIYNVPFLQWGLGCLPGSQPKKYSLFRLVESFSDGAIAYSSNAFAYYTKHVGLDKENVFNAVNTVDTRGIPFYCESSQSEYFDMFYIGALIPSKKPLELLQAFHLLSDNHARFEKKLRLHFVGDGPSFMQLQSFVRHHRLSNVYMHGSIVAKELSSLLSCGDLVIMPGLGGLVVSESIAHGIPVLASHGDGSEADWLSAGCGRIIPDASPLALSEEISTILSSPNILKLYRSNCSLALQTFGYHNYYAKICECLDSFG